MSAVALILTAGEQRQIVQQIALWPVCPTCRGKAIIYAIDPIGLEMDCPDCVKGRIPGPVYLTAEGDRPVEPLDVALEAAVHDRRVAPSRFVEATGPCETCGGKNGRMIHGHLLHEDLAGLMVECPDCIDGRKRVALAIEVPSQSIAALESGAAWEHVVSAHAIVTVLPVYDTTDVPDNEDPMAAYDEAGDWVEHDRDSGVHLWWHADRKIDGAYCTYLTLDPLPVPGRDFVVVFDGLEMT